jgi:class 3 adenylate cyclase/tetratricopeptide (TPR) repeat protein
VICPSCGFAVGPAARFCGGCGARLEAVADPVPEAERRHICLLFCDLVGSTPLSQYLDAEDLLDVLGSYRRACEDTVLRHNGFVAAYYGDGIEVYFGYPHASEDDAARAVRCALDILEAVRQLAKRMKLDLQVRIGIDSGRVVVGTLGGAHRFAVGETPNIAARIQAEAAPGEVVVTGSLRRRLPETFVLESMGLRALKGIERSLELFRIVASSGHATLGNRPVTPFIGRVAQRKRILEIWARAIDETPQFVVLRGEPGIGKSRLVEVARNEIANDHAEVLVARCTPVTADTALHPFVELIGLHLGFEGKSAEEQMTRLADRLMEIGLPPGEAVPLLASILSIPVDPAVWPAPDLSPTRARQRTMDILIAMTFALTLHGPVVVVIEDVHWADPSTVELLRQLIASRRPASLMAVLTARPEFAPTWTEATNVTAVELGSLELAESEIFIRKVAHDKPLPPEVMWKIRERAGDNPLFLEEITRSIMESGALVEREHAWELVGVLSSEVVPDSIDASLTARFDRLGDARPLFQLAATTGREFSYEVLAAVADMPDEALRRSIDVILRSGLVYQVDETSGVYTFKHALIRDAAYDSLLRATRRRHHARIAKVMAARFPQITENHPELLAHHLTGAGMHGAAAAHWQAAGENAARRSAVQEAVAHLRRALAALERLPRGSKRMDRELSVLTSLAPALMAVYGWASSEVGEACSRAIGLAGRLGTDDRMYAPLWGLWTNQFVGGRLHEAMETADQVLAMALSSADGMLEVTARHATSYTRYYRGEYDLAIAEAQAGLRGYNYDLELTIAQTFQLSSTICSMTAKASSLWMLGRQREGVAFMEEMVALARSLRHPPSVASSLAFAMFFFLYDRDWKRLFEYADETYELSQAEGFAMWTANAGMHRGRARVGLGQVDAGVAEVLEWGALFRQTGSGIVEGSVTSMVSEALHMASHSEEALSVSAEGERRAEIGFVRVMMPEIFRTRGDILRDLDRLDEADDAYHRAVDCARSQGARSLELRALVSLLDLRLACGPPAGVPAELCRVIDAMPGQEDRPDVRAAHALLTHARGVAPRREKLSSP